MPDRESDVAAPDVDDRGAAAVVGVVHAEVVAPRVAGLDGQHPVRA